LTGLELVDREDVERLRQLNLIASLQLTIDWVLPNEPIFKDLVELVGKERAKNAIPLR